MAICNVRYGTVKGLRFKVVAESDTDSKEALY